MFCALVNQINCGVRFRSGIIELTIGSPLNKPLLRAARVCGDLDLSASKEARIDSVINYWLERTDDLVEEFVQGKLTVY